MAPSPDTPESIMAAAQALIDQVQRDLASSEDEFLRHGIDPTQLRAYLESRVTDADREQLKQAVQADMEAVEQEVREELTRRAFSRSSGSVARRRSMI